MFPIHPVFNEHSRRAGFYATNTQKLCQKYKEETRSSAGHMKF